MGDKLRSLLSRNVSDDDDESDDGDYAPDPELQGPQNKKPKLAGKIGKTSEADAENG